jgi:hypothetical protein
MVMAMRLLSEIAEVTLLSLMEASKHMIWVLRYFHIVPGTDAKSFYITYVYLNYI